MIGLATARGEASNQRDALLDLQQADSRLAIVANRLLIANVGLCDRRMPATGASIHALDQYPLSLRPEAIGDFGFEAPVSIEVVVPGGPAARAGLRPADAILAINSLAMPRTVTSKAATSATRDSIERSIALLPANEPITFRILRSGVEQTVVLLPAPACRSRFEVAPGGRPQARSDGETIQISSGFLRRFDDAALAVIFAHELAHTILKHRALIAGTASHKKQVVREAEREADRLSVHLLANAGYDPAIAPQFWREHGDAIALLAFGDTTHDSPRARTQMLEEEIVKMRPH
jgi:hypothetical protein